MLKEYTNKPKIGGTCLQIMHLLHDWYPEHTKKCQDLVITKQRIQENNRAKDLHSSFYKEDIHWW